MFSGSLVNLKIVVSHNFSLNTSGRIHKRLRFTFRCFHVLPAGRPQGKGAENESAYLDFINFTLVSLDFAFFLFLWNLWSWGAKKLSCDGISRDGIFNAQRLESSEVEVERGEWLCPDSEIENLGCVWRKTFKKSILIRELHKNLVKDWQF